ncbi:DUF3267 domain-containing protein [Virgibacillus alimentarius]|uniref:DUF3267 domain-containing protein n=1 Tax=Virgibacillus alimentarius TaxID=698769 RepID=A0ABS4SCI5_9BACI|nr:MULTISPECIES: DUF3267 domain-containing protein [Virgibacillus]MBP2258841.1 hypothetical protein [Virgibacillus alimentarius]HLR65760.1 DUF3267 domain-containing protein [Virgibacillus sp.]
MICWKSINITKEFGLKRIYLISSLIGLMAFVILYVPFSILHKNVLLNESGIVLFIFGIILLPLMHLLMHILPLFILNKKIKVTYKNKSKKRTLPLLTYYTKAYVSKKVSLLVALAPTIFITIPGMIATYLLADFYVYLLLLTTVHIGISFTDFLYVLYIAKAPKQSFIENDNNGFDILIKAPR